MVDAAAVNAILKEVEKYRSRLEELEKQKNLLEVELPLVKGNLETLTKSLEILRGKKVETTKEQKPPLSLISPVSTEDLRYLLRKDSLTDIAYSILKENGNPLNITELFNRVKQKRSGIGKSSFASGVYRLLKLGRVFKKYDGKIGLLEWKDRSSK
jgi:hypothetical protein